MITINLLSVLISAVAAFIVGFLFHGPLFGKLWMKLANIHPTGNEKFKDMIPQMSMNLLMNIITSLILAMFIYTVSSYYNNVGSIIGGMGIAFWAWFGFLFTSSSMDIIWMGKSKKLWAFELASSLATFVTMGAILAAFMPL